MRHCTRCDTDKPLSEFYTKGHGKRGPLIQSWCKDCLNSYKHSRHHYYQPKRKKRAVVDLSLNRYLWSPSA